jgi:hypothetical protein
MEPGASELFVMLRDPQIRQRILNPPERRTSTELQAAERTLRFRLAQALRVLAAEVAQCRATVERLGSRQGAIVH